MNREAFAWAGTSAGRAEPLAGDASTRSYYRVRRGKSSVVLMVFDDDELSRRQAARFCETRAWLERLGIPVPEILEVSDDKRWQLLQDLGDVTLESWLRVPPSVSEVTGNYEILADYLRRIQGGAGPSFLSDCPPLARDLLRQELVFFHEHFLAGKDEARFSAFFKRLAAAASCEALLPAHRDYHCRNVMLCDKTLYLVDFQDARYAHPLYDVASLVYDAYLDPGDQAKEIVLAAWDDLRDLRVVALQRNLKAVGTFAYQSRVRGKSFYERFIPHCLALAREHLRVLGWTEELRLLKGATSL